MASRRRNTKKPNPAADHRTDDAPQALDVAAWARRVLTETAHEISTEDLVVLESQLKLITRLEPSSAPLPLDPTAPTIIRERKTLKQVASRLESASEIVIDLETSTLDPGEGEIVGVGLSTGDTNYYLPISHRFEATKSLRPDQLPIDVVARELRLGQLPLIAHNAKFEFRWLRRHASVTCHFLWDVMLAARLLASHLPADLKDLAARELDVPDWSLPKEEIAAVQLMPVERVARYCVKDCRYTLELYRRQLTCLS